MLTPVMYTRQRWFDADLGRWLTPDPIGFSGGLNLYAYVENQPVGAVDPEGEQGTFSGWLVELMQNSGMRKVTRLIGLDALVEAVASGNDVLCDSKATAKEVAKQFPKPHPERRHHPREVQRPRRDNPGGRPAFKPKGHYHTELPSGARPHIFYSLGNLLFLTGELRANLDIQAQGGLTMPQPDFRPGLIHPEYQWTLGPGWHPVPQLMYPDNHFWRERACEDARNRRI